MKRIYLPILLFVLLVSSCDTFNKVPSAEWPSEGAITTLEDLEYAVNGVYESQVNLLDGDNPRGGYSGDFTIFADQRGSDFKAYGNNNQTIDVFGYQATKNSTDAYYFYKRFYVSLARINKVIQGAKQAGLEGDEADVLLGELYALRALFHFDLARLFAKMPCNAQPTDLGIVLSTQVYDSKYIGERATLAETYQTILDDFETALSLLPEDGGTTLGHINYWAARALRARVYLYMGENANALADAKYVIKNSPYKLYTRAEYTEVWGKEGTSESLFEFLVTSLYNAQRNSLGYYTRADGYAEAGITEGFKDFLQARPTDIRSTLIGFIADSNTTYEGWYMQKYPGRNGDIYVDNPKVIRLSEVYLIAAEAAVKEGDSSATGFINDLRRNRIEDYDDVASVTIDDVLTECRLELYGENHNAWDTWRNQRTVINAQIPNDPIAYDDYRTVMPIPVDEINVSNGKLIQNEGY